jgi:hypothetical protein
MCRGYNAVFFAACVCAMQQPFYFFNPSSFLFQEEQGTPITSLFKPLQVGDMSLANRIVMAPLTRNRAPNATPTPLIVEYYKHSAPLQI